MNLKSFVGTSLLIILMRSLSAESAQESPDKLAPGASSATAAVSTKDSIDSTDSTDRAELEKKFKETLTKSIFEGRWCMIEDGKLGQEHNDKYTIQSANKISQDLWLIYARVQYGDKDLLVPIPVNVKWAGDTPVISITNLGIPGLGTYTARVVVYGNLYAGTWSAPDHGGQLHGVIVKQE